MNDNQKIIMVLGLMVLIYVVFLKPVTYTYHWQEKEVIYIPAKRGFGAVAEGTTKPTEQTIIKNHQEQRIAVEPTALRACAVALITTGLVFVFKTPRNRDE